MKTVETVCKKGYLNSYNSMIEYVTIRKLKG